MTEIINKKEELKEHRKKYYLKNRDRILDYSKEHHTIKPKKYFNCGFCGKPLPKNSHFNKKFCNIKCAERVRYSRDREKRLLQCKTYQAKKNLNKPLKNCLYCGKLIPRESFYGLKLYCNSKCREASKYINNKEKIRCTQKIYKEKNKDKILQHNKEYYQNNKDKIKAKVNEYRLDNKSLLRAKRDEYYLKNKDKLKENRHKNWKRILHLERERKRQDPNFAIKKRIRRLLASSLKVYTLEGKLYSSKKYGIDFSLIIEHLKPFPDDLSKYHIDHIKPLCSFNFVNPDGSTNLEEIKKAFAPENHQWLTKEENIKKGGKLIYPQNKPLLNFPCK